MSAAGQPCQTDMAALVKSLELFGLESTAAKTIAAKLVLEQGHRGRTYLQLQLPPSAVRFVDTEECLLEAFSALEEDGAMGVLGLDCEWDSAAGRWAPVSILQIASRSMVLIIDLLALGSSPVLDTVLTKLLKPDTPIKAGCAVCDDIDAIARSYPSLKAFQACSGLLDLRTVFVQHVAATGLPVSKPVNKLHGVGLSLMAEACLGRPLDKTAQQSAWADRPLSSRQLTYAALDAHVAVLIYDKMVERDGARFLAQVQAALSSGPLVAHTDPQQQ